MKSLVVFTAVMLTLFAACSTTGEKVQRPYYSDSNDCKAILDNPWGGPQHMPPGCVGR